MATEKFPVVPKELIERLEQIFPDTIPMGPVSIEGLREVQGQQTVVRLLRHHFTKQSENILENT